MEMAIRTKTRKGKRYQNRDDTKALTNEKGNEDNTRYL
jgi:hypothetical protein